MAAAAAAVLCGRIHRNGFFETNTHTQRETQWKKHTQIFFCCEQFPIRTSNNYKKPKIFTVTITLLYKYIILNLCICIIKFSFLHFVLIRFDSYCLSFIHSFQFFSSSCVYVLIRRKNKKKKTTTTTTTENQTATLCVLFNFFFEFHNIKNAERKMIC